MNSSIIIRIEYQNGQYTGQVSHGNRTYDPGNLKLDPDETITIGDKFITLKALAHATIGYGEADFDFASDERGQMVVGQYLYSRVFTSENRSILKSAGENPHIRILTKDEHIGRLPWMLMAEKSGMFLSGMGCAISMASHDHWVSGQLPVSLKILVAAPQPANRLDTRAE